MKKRPKNTGREPPIRKPTAADFEGGAVQKAILGQTVQSPFTILPAAAAFVALFYGLVINFSFSAIVASLLFGATALGSWVFNFFIRGEQLSARYVTKLRELRREYQVRQVVDIESECHKIGFSEGAKEANELSAAYLKLKNFLDRQIKDGENLKAERFRILAEDTYDQGVGILTRALNSYRAVQQIDAPLLRQELENWQAELADFRDVEGKEVECQALEQKIASHTKRLANYEERNDVIAQLLAQSDSLEAALENAFLGLQDLIGQSADIMFGDTSSGELEKMVTAARRVEERLRGLNHTDVHPDDEMYAQAGRQV